MLSKNLENALHRALDYANEQKHEFATLEHLLLALIDDEDARNSVSYTHLTLPTNREV